MKTHRALPLVGFTLTLVLGLVAAASCGGGGGGGGDSPTAPPAPPPPGQTVTVEIFENRFSPKSVRINAGTTVRWVFRGADPTHTVTARNGAFSSGLVFRNPGDAFQHTFSGADAGRTFEYSCGTHQLCCEMQGSVLVGTTAPDPNPGY